METVRTRIAPSPTGFAHIGTAYTALFNYAFAKKHKGKFILRIEDTDTKRNVAKAEDAIYNGLKWLGLEWDEGPDIGGALGPYRQSERLDTYQGRARGLVEEGLAYDSDGAVRFKNPGEDVGWDDLVRGNIKFSGGEITDFVILKSDGYPTYNFSVVMDDISMKITHVIRGEEHISNTPRQLALYKAFGVTPPEFAHLPTLRNKDKKKLSKRRDPVDLSIYQRDGYLPEALLNFISLLGFSHPDEKEIFSLEEFVQIFDIKRVRRAGPIFDTQKLDWINGEYIKSTEDSKLKNMLYEFFGKKYQRDKIGKIVPLVKQRINTLKDFDSLAGFFFTRPKVDKKALGKNAKEHINSAIKALSGIDWESGKIDNALAGAVEEGKFKTGDFFMDLRIAITGKRVTPPINDSIVILDREEVLTRLRRII